MKKQKRTPKTTSSEPAAFSLELRDGHYQGVPRSALYVGAPISLDPPEGATLQASAADDDGEGSPGVTRRKFRGVVNSGRVFKHFFWGNFAIDMAGLKIPTQRMPLLRDHDAGKIAGVTSKVAVNEHQLHAEGEILGVTDAGREVLALAEEEFPFQMSAWFQPSKILRIEAGEEHEVNGQKLTGPGHVFAESTIYEATVTALGADSNTELALMSQSQGERLSLPVSRKSHKGKTMTDTDDADDEVRLTKGEAEKLAKERAETAAAEARKAERERLTRIDQLAAGKGVPAELVAKFRDDGSSPEAFAVAVLEWQGTHKAELLTALGAKSPKPNGVGATDADDDAGGEEIFTEGGGKQPKAHLKAIEAMPDGEARWKAEFAAKAGDAAKHEFEDEAQYLGFKALNQLQGV